MKVPKPLLVQMIKMMCPDAEKQKVMLDVLDKLNLDDVQNTEDVAKILNNPEELSRLADSAGHHDGTSLHVENEMKVIAAVSE